VEAAAAGWEEKVGRRRAAEEQGRALEGEVERWKQLAVGLQGSADQLVERIMRSGRYGQYLAIMF